MTRGGEESPPRLFSSEGDDLTNMMTTLDPKTRQALRVTVKEGEQLLTDQVISDLMGKDVAARFKLITENAADIGELDV